MTQDRHHFSWTTTKTQLLPTPSPVPHLSKTTPTQEDPDFHPKDLKPIPPKTTKHLQGFPSPKNQMSDPNPQTATNHLPPNPTSTTLGLLHTVIPRTDPGSAKTHKNSKTEAEPQTFNFIPDFRPKTTANPQAIPVPESSTSSARELRVKIKQVAAAFFNGSRVVPIRKPMADQDLLEDKKGGSRPPSGSRTSIPSEGAISEAMKDCSDHLLRKGSVKSGVYQVTPDLHTGVGFPVLCDMEVQGGGWTVLQLRRDGGVSFNRTWAEYRSGFGEPSTGGDFWLGNQHIHLLTRDRDMTLRVELEDFSGTSAYAEYENFRVGSERMRYRLTLGAYSGTAGNALRFSPTYDHHNRAFTTPDRDNDRYPSGNCGAYYGSGWWFDACMAANLNGKYYRGRYKGVRDGIYWGTWHNISTELYPTNERQAFKTVRMMIRPKKNFT
ncbi:fibroleukin-like [Stigmatopora nigra]